MIDWSSFKKESGIYCFKNTVNGKCYIGQAVNIRNRMRAHLGAIKSQKHGGLLLYKAINKHGLENFEVSILETVQTVEGQDIKSILDDLEKKYIKELNTHAPNGYNMTLGGDAGVLRLKMTEEQKKKISIAATEQAEETRKPVYIWDFVNNKEYMSMSVLSAGDNPYIPLSRGSIQLLINNKKQIIKGCIAAESEEDLFKKRDQIIKDNIPITNNGGLFKSGGRKYDGKPVIVVRHSKVIQEFSNLKSAADYYNVPPTTLGRYVRTNVPFRDCVLLYK